MRVMRCFLPPRREKTTWIIVYLRNNHSGQIKLSGMIFETHRIPLAESVNPMSKLFSTQGLMRNITPLGDIPESGDVLKKTLRMAWPSMVESFLFALVSFIDTMMVSTLGDSAIAAVGLTSQPRMICLAVFFALQPAVSALVARRRGEGDRDSAIKIVKLALVLGFVLIAVISTLAVIFAGPAMELAGALPDTYALSTSYFRIIIGGMVFNVMTLIINAGQRGSGNTKISMRTNIVSNIVNVMGNYLLIGGNLGFPALGVNGAAIATVFGQFCGFLMALASVLHVDGYMNIRHKTGGIFEKRSAKSLLNLGLSTFSEQIILRAGFLLYAIIIARLGSLEFATHQIGMQFMMISFSFGDGLSVAAVALVGYSLGQNRSDMARIYGAFCQRIGLICSGILCAVYVVFGRKLFALFSENEQVLRDGTVIMWMLCAIILFQISQVIFSGCLRGAGDSKYIAVVSFINIGILRPLLAFVLSTYLGYGIIGAWAGLVIDQAIRLGMTSTRFYSGKWTKIKI
jgi:putative MATE family efflux protein